MHEIDRFSTVEEALIESLRVDDLKKLVSLTGITPNSGRKADLIAVIVKYLSGDNLRAVWKNLNHMQKAAIAEVVHSSKNYLDSYNFNAKYGADPDWGTEDNYHRIVAPSPLCLFFCKGLMSDDIKTRLKEFVPLPQKANITTLSELPIIYKHPYEEYDWKTRKMKTLFNELTLTIHETEMTAQCELISILRLVDAGKVVVSSKTFRPSKATIESITGVLEGVDYYHILPVKNEWDDENSGPIRAFAWPLLIQAGGLAVLAGSKLQLTGAGRKALSRDPVETIRVLWNKWVKTTLLDELSRVDIIKGQTGKAKRHLTALASRRKAVSKALSQCPVGSWFLVDDFYKFIFALNIPFSVTRNPWGLYIGDPHYGSFGYEEGLFLLEQRYLFCLLLEYAATLGLIDVALTPPASARRDFHSMWGTDDLLSLSRYDGLFFLRITPLGAFCLGRTKTLTSKTVNRESVIVVQPSLEIVAKGDKLTAGDRLALDSYAINTSDFTWRLDQGKLLNAVEEGRSISEIRDFLMAKSENDLPDTVTHLFMDIEKKCTQLQEKGLVRLIECADPALAALIVNDTQAGKHCMAAGERHLVVSSSEETKFKRALNKLGYIIAPNKQ